MAFFIIIVGILQALSGLLIYASAVSAIHEIFAATTFGFGILTFALGAIMVRLDDIRENTSNQLKIFADRVQKSAK